MTDINFFDIAERLVSNARAVRADVECDSPDFWNTALIDEIVRDAKTLKDAISQADAG